MKGLVKVKEFQTDSLDLGHFLFEHHQFLLCWVEFTRSLQTNLLLKINTLSLIYANFFVKNSYTVVLCNSIFIYFQLYFSLYSDTFIPFNFTTNSLLATISSLMLNLQPYFSDIYSMVCLFVANLN